MVVRGQRRQMYKEAYILGSHLGMRDVSLDELPKENANGPFGGEVVGKG